MDWVRFLDDNHIHYVTRGPNTKKGEVSITCPMCTDDPSEHLGINLSNGYWGCHRNSAHRGKSAKTLIRAILGTSYTGADSYLRQYSHSDPDDLDKVLEALKEPKQEIAPDRVFPICEAEFNNFRLIKPRGSTKRFFSYIQGRDFDDPKAIIESYSLRCATTGRYKDRVIIPIRHNSELLGWTSRAICKVENAPRYLASSEDVKTTVFNFDELKKGGQRLFVVEGPFDAIKVDSAGHVQKVPYRATCTFGTSSTLSQIALLRVLVKKFKETFVLFDQGADEPARNLAEWIGAKTAWLPIGVKDPGELRPSELKNMGLVSYNGTLYDFLSIQQLSRQVVRNFKRTNRILPDLIKK